MKSQEMRKAINRDIAEIYEMKFEALKMAGSLYLFYVPPANLFSRYKIPLKIR